jgi:hypothetical protein
MGSISIFAIVQRSWRAAARVVLSDVHIQATTLLRKEVLLQWDQVTELQQWERSSFGGSRHKVVRLLSDDAREIILTSRIQGFDELMAQVVARMRYARETEPGAWERVSRSM